MLQDVTALIDMDQVACCYALTTSEIGLYADIIVYLSKFGYHMIQQELHDSEKTDSVKP